MSVGARTAYDIRSYTDADEAQVLGLLTAALAGGPTGERTGEFFRWKHQRNPFGRSLALVADAHGELVGFRAFMRWRFEDSRRQTLAAARAVDTATHPAHQGRGVFKTLTLTALDELRAATDLIFNTPNASSLPGYLKMGWRPVGTVPIHVRWRPRRLLPGDQACGLPVAGDVLDGELDDLMAAATSDDGRWHTERTAAYLRWRYADAPGLDYRALRLERDGRLAGLAIGRQRMRGRAAEFTLSELLVPRDDPALARLLLRAVAARSGCDHVATHLAPGMAPHRAALRAGYVALPRTGMTLVANPLRPVTPDPLSLASWAFALGDLEAF